MKTVRLLEIGDMQFGFTRKAGNLYVSGAEDIINPANSFLRRLSDVFFDYTLIILDTHFAEEYSLSEEGKLFPIHCEYGTRDWELTVDVSGLANRHYITKNDFNLWSDVRTPDHAFTDQKRKKVHRNLFHVTDDPHNPATAISRDVFVSSISQNGNSSGIEVTLFGVASDYCNRYAMEGWLERGARVTIIHDLTRGIEKETEEVLREDKYRKYLGKRLRSVSGSDYLRELENL